MLEVVDVSYNLLGAKLGMTRHQYGVMMYLEILTSSCQSTFDDDIQ